MTKKRYAVTIINNKLASVEVDGVSCARPEDIPDVKDQAKMAIVVADLVDTDLFDFDEPKEKAGKDTHFKFEYIILGAFALIGLILLTIAALSGWQTIQKTQREVSTPGRVVQVVEYESSDGSITYYPVVQFTGLDTTNYTVEVAYGSSPASFETGEMVTVLYNPNKPNEARIKSVGSSIGGWILPGITGGMGIIFLAMVFFVWYVSRQAV